MTEYNGCRVHHFDQKGEGIMANPFVHVELMTTDVIRALNVKGGNQP